MQNTIIYRNESYKIQGACFEVYKHTGCGFLEAVYQEALAMEFHLQDIPFVEKYELALNYKGYQLKQTYKPDFICYGKIIVELKAVSSILPEHEAQLINYLKMTNMKLGLLVNFCAYPHVDIRRKAL